MDLAAALKFRNQTCIKQFSPQNIIRFHKGTSLQVYAACTEHGDHTLPVLCPTKKLIPLYFCLNDDTGGTRGR